MKNLPARLALIPLLAVLLGSCGKKEEPAAEVAREAESGLPATEQIVAAPDGGSEPQKDSDFLNPPKPMTAEAPVPISEDQAAYEAWFKKHGLDLNAPKMLDADPDGDGVTNRDEFLADSDPHDANSRPGIHRAMRLKEYNEVRLPIILEAVEGGAARVRRTEAGESRVEAVRAGETIRGLPLKVERVEARRETDKNGLPVDVSRVTLEDVATKEKVVLVKDLPAKTAASFAVLVSPDGRTTLKVRQGEIFSWPEEMGATYKVMDMSQDQVVLQQVENQKMWTIPRP